MRTFLERKYMYILEEQFFNKYRRKTMNEKKEKVNNDELKIITSYAVIVVHTLINSATKLTPKAIRSEVEMYYKKFGNSEVKKLANSIMESNK